MKDSIKELQRQAMLSFLHDWERELRQKTKYEGKWLEASEEYYRLREEHLLFDVTEIDTDEEIY